MLFRRKNKDVEQNFKQNFNLDQIQQDYSKEELLDNNFKKAEKSITKGQVSQKKVKRPFLKSGYALLIVAVISLVVINYLPWAYIECDSYTEDKQIVDVIYGRTSEDNLEHTEVKNIFRTPEGSCTNSTCNFIGLNFQDFRDSYGKSFYGLVFLGLLALLFIIFQIIDRYKKVSDYFFLFIHSLFSAVTIIVSLFLAIWLIKFVSAVVMTVNNSKFLVTKNVLLIPLVPLLLLFILLVTVKVSYSILKSNFRDIQDKAVKRDLKSRLSYYFNRGAQWKRK